MTTDAAQAFMEKAEEARDIRNQLQGLSAEEQSGIFFREWSPGRTMVYLWNTETGEEILVPRYQGVAALNLPNSRGTGYLWTAKREQAPEPRKGTVKCFLHPESPERPFLDENGITTVCMSAHLASNSSKWAHARNRHPSAYEAYQTEVQAQEQKRRDDLQAQQTDAMLRLAGGAKRGPGRPRKEAGEEEDDGDST